MKTMRTQPCSILMAAGRFAVTPPDAGRYLMLVRYRVGTPAAGSPATSYTITLAFEAM